MNDIARAYVELAHAIEQHNPGYIDGYYGPEEWKVTAKRPLVELALAADALADKVAAIENQQRRRFLAAQVRAMQTSIALLQGKPIAYADEVRQLYDVEPVREPETTFDAAIARLDDLLPGSGDITAREQAFRAQFEVAQDRLLPLLDYIRAELGRRTRALFELPEPFPD
jgi:hypothetical protein